MADIHLTRAWLFGRPAAADAYPWQSVEHDLAEARRLITTCGYHRRDRELADAEAALLPGGAALRSVAEHSGTPPNTY